MLSIISCPLGLHVSKQLGQTTNIPPPRSQNNSLFLEITAFTLSCSGKNMQAMGGQQKEPSARCAHLRSRSI